MSSKLRRSWRLPAVATIVLALAVGVGVATGAIPDGGGVIHGCYVSGTGQLRVYDSESATSKKCGSNESALTWNQKGPQGAQGPKGDKGETGATGSAGSAGPAGPAGAAGASGTSHAYTATNTLSTEPDSTREIVGLSGVPDGSYVVWATMRNKGGGDIACVIGVPGTGSIISALDFQTIKDGSSGTITGMVSLTGTNKIVDIQCDSPTNDTVSIDALIVAIKVDAVN